MNLTGVNLLGTSIKGQGIKIRQQTTFYYFFVAPKLKPYKGYHGVPNPIAVESLKFELNSVATGSIPLRV